MWINELAREGYLEKTGDQYPVVRPGMRSLNLTAKVMLTVPAGGATPRAAASRAAVPARPDDMDLLGRLKGLRKSIADAAGVPPYIIFADKSLIEMARVRPCDPESFGTITGVGEHKLNKYGPAFIGEILSFCGTT